MSGLFLCAILLMCYITYRKFKQQFTPSEGLPWRYNDVNCIDIKTLLAEKPLITLLFCDRL